MKSAINNCCDFNVMYFYIFDKVSQIFSGFYGPSVMSNKLHISVNKEAAILGLILMIGLILEMAIARPGPAFEWVYVHHGGIHGT